MSKLLIIPTDTIQRFCNSVEDFKFFFSRFPYEAIIELAVSLESHRDFSSALWCEIEQKLTDDELNLLVLDNVDTVLEIITEMFYEELRNIGKDFDINYKIHCWLPDSVCLIPDNDNLQLRDTTNDVRYHYLASEF